MSTDGVSIVDGQAITYDKPAAPAPAPKPPTPAESAERYLRENFAVYANPNHPDQPKVKREVEARFKQAHPGRPWDGFTVTAREPYEPPTPPAEVKAPPKPAAPPDALNARPATPGEYDLALGDPPAGISWDLATVNDLKRVLFDVGVTRHQAQSLASYWVNSILPDLQRRGLAAIDDKAAENFEYRLKALGLTYKQAEKIDDALQKLHPTIRPIPEGLPPDLADRKAELMKWGSPYWTPDHPHHRQYRQAVSALHEEIEQRKARGEFR